MKKVINIFSVLSILLSQTGCIGGNSSEKKEDVSFPYATQEIKQQLVKQLLDVQENIPEDYFETIIYTPIMEKMRENGPSIFGEKVEQQVFWYYVMRLRMLTMYYTYPRAIDDWGILVEMLNGLGGFAREFIEQHPQEGKDIFASVIAYEEKYPYNPQKGIDDKKNKLKNMTRQEIAEEFGASIEELNKMSEDELKNDIQDIIDSIDDVPAKFGEVREEIIKAFKNDLEQMQSGLSPEEYVAKKKEENGIAEYTIYLEAPKLFPVELGAAEFVLDDEDDSKRYAFRKLFFSNDGIGGTRIENEKPLPHKVEMIWYSIVENKVYMLLADLPYKKIKERIISPDNEGFLGLLMRLSPYGKVDLYAYNTITEEKEFLGSFKAEKAEANLDDFRTMGTLYENEENLAKDWADYQKRALTNFPEAATLLAQKGLPSQDFDFWSDKITDLKK